jgi:hypothetical protein
MKGRRSILPCARGNSARSNWKGWDKWDARALRLVEPTARRERVPTGLTRLARGNWKGRDEVGRAGVRPYQVDALGARKP